MGFLKAAVTAALLLMLCGCGEERSTEAKSNPQPVDMQVDRRVYDLERRLEEVQIAHAILIEGLSHQNSPLDRGLIEKLKNNSGITLQWIGSERGTLTVTESSGGMVSLSGRQASAGGRNTLSLEGRIVFSTPTAFVMVGTIDFDIQNRPPRCRREGAFTFRITGDRRYWRLLEKTGYCGIYTDYVDIFL